jgi:tRNA dimethylallyltransferase
LLNRTAGRRHAMQESPEFTDCWFLSGATATGKTQVGIEVARRLGAEIISLDSMAIYRGMDIGTAKPTAVERAAVPHHLLDIREPHEEFSVAEYVEAAARAVVEIRGRGREVLFVGGTPLYLKALLRGLDNVPEPDPAFRRLVEEEVGHLAPRELHRRVAQIDPLAASHIHPNDTKRLIRVLEVYKQTGQPLSHFQFRFEEPRSAVRCVFVLRRPRSELHRRIDQRVEAMFRRGLVEEVQGILHNGQPLSRTAHQAVGYKEVLEHLAGRQSREEAIENTKNRTHRFARKQETWFRSLSECRFVELQGDTPRPETIAEQIRGIAGFDVDRGDETTN